MEPNVCVVENVCDVALSSTRHELTECKCENRIAAPTNGAMKKAKAAGCPCKANRTKTNQEEVTNSQGQASTCRPCKLGSGK